MTQLDSSAELSTRPAERRGSEPQDGYLPIGDYGAIGDGRTLALVGRDGSIDWMCLPDLDSPSVFGAIINPLSGGRFVVQPSVPFEAERRYLERTNVLETTFTTAEGTVRVTDTLTLDPSQVAPWRELVRRVEGVSGSVPVTWRFEPSYEFGQKELTFMRFHGALVARIGELQLGLQAWDAGAAEDMRSGEFTCAEDDTALLVMTATDKAPLSLPRREAIERRLDATPEVWRGWVARHSYDGQWRAAVERSLLAIRLLADGRTGAIAAAGTNSLPEVVGGSGNYDYRFGWVRDASFTLDALLAVGMEELAHNSMTWLLKAVRSTHPRVDPLYGLNGDVIRSQSTLPVPGYRWTTPVHLGNKAGSQLQLGGFGDLLETLYLYVCHGHVLTPAIGERLADNVDLLCRIWRTEDAGLWELPQNAHYATSKIGCWSAIERLLDLVDRGQVPARHVDRWRAEREAIAAFIEQELWSEDKRSYLMKAGSDALDCGVLLAGRRGYADPKGERFNATIDAIRRELGGPGPLVYRYSGTQDKENCFLACSFWVVEALALAGRVDEARPMMEELIDLGSDLGLYSEEMTPKSHEMRGNIPQALTHLSLINAAVAVERAGGS
ncbi:MAG TPA: glycoside hydrolase family 15 protein [Solirubrobacteraceae bacterium]|nr:glycoside hydrolase family 15 protein [Solirubrobacteraceae bacterium]